MKHKANVIMIWQTIPCMIGVYRKLHYYNFRTPAP